MQISILIHAFTGDGATCLANRSPNEIVFTGIGATNGIFFNSIVPGAMQVQLLAPTSRTLQVISVNKDGAAFHAPLARFDDEPPVHSGLYLCAFSVNVFVTPDFYVGQALATVRIDEDMPAIPRPDPGPEESRQSDLT